MYDSVLELMQDTPLVALRGRACNTRRAALFAKLELAQPGAMKDRIARTLITAAASTGALPPGGTIIESSSGTMAEGLARVGVMLGYNVIIVTAKDLDPLMRAKLVAFGARLELVEKPDPQSGWQGARLRRLGELRKQNPTMFWPMQYDNPAIPRAYGEELGQEIVEELGDIDAFVAGVGSGSSLCGTAKALREANPRCRIIAVDAVGSVQFHQPKKDRLQSGHGNSIIAGNIDYSIIDEVHWLADGETFNACRELARREGIFAGGSSGASYIVASWIAEQLPREATVVTLFPDRGDRYVQSIYDCRFMEEKGLAPIVAGPEPNTVRYGEPVQRWSRALLPRDGSVPYYEEGTPKSVEFC